VAGELVLVVDDTVANVVLLRAVLAARGYQVDSAATADEARQAITRRRPDVILMDLQLPVVDGLTLTRELRAQPGGGDLLIIAVTSYAMATDREKAIRAGCDDYVSKPIDTRQLPELVARHLTERGRRSASRDG
jgi:CheY-like chemotaxis protein